MTVGKRNVAVGVGVSVGVEVGNGVVVQVSVGEGSTNAVCVCAAPAVATTIVCMAPGAGVGFEAAGNGNPGTAHANRTNNTTNGNRIFLEGVFMIVYQEPYLVSKTNRTEQKFVWPTLRDHRMLYSLGRFGTSIATETVTVPPVPTPEGIS